MITWFKTIEQAAQAVKNNNATILNESFTAMVMECRGYSACGLETAKVINYLHEQAHPTCHYSAYPEALYLSYEHNSLTEKLDMQFMCPEVDFA